VVASNYGSLNVSPSVLVGYFIGLRGRALLCPLSILMVGFALVRGTPENPSQTRKLALIMISLQLRRCKEMRDEGAASGCGRGVGTVRMRQPEWRLQ
jgi:hypothetical protein